MDSATQDMDGNGKAKFFVSIFDPRHEAQELIELSAQTEHAAKIEARDLQQHTGPAKRRVKLFERCTGYTSYRGALVGAAERWEQP